MVKMQPLMIVNISKLNTLECSTVHQIKMRLFKAVLSCSPRHSWARARIRILLGQRNSIRGSILSCWRSSWPLGGGTHGPVSSPVSGGFFTAISRINRHVALSLSWKYPNLNLRFLIFWYNAPNYDFIRTLQTWWLMMRPQGSNCCLWCLRGIVQQVAPSSDGHGRIFDSQLVT